MQSRAEQQSRNRADFAAAMARIKPGMHTNEIIEILGKPDDIRTQTDPAGISRVNTKQIWCYGTESHLSFPTLGCVYIDESGDSQESFGGLGQPPRPSLFAEDELNELLRLLDAAPGLDGYNYNPLPVIQIVNKLQPLGKEKALAAVAEYVRVSDGWSSFHGPRFGMYLVLAVLFDLPDGFYSDQAGGFGAPDPGPPKDPNRIPRYPIAIVDDIPLMLVNGYELAGMPSRMENIVDFYLVHGRMREKQLVPTNAPLAVIEHLANSPAWIFGDTNLQKTEFSISFGPADDSKREKSMLMEQVLRLIDSVYQMPTDALGMRLPWDEEQRDHAWQKIVSDISALQIKWDPRQNSYTFQDGKHLPPVEKHIYQRQIWKINGLGYENAELVLQRKDENWLKVMVDYSDAANAKLTPAVIHLFSVSDTHTPIFTTQLIKIKGSGSGTTDSSTIGLKAGTDVIAKLITVNHQTNSSPVFKP